MERRNFLKFPLAIGGAVLATQAVGIKAASAADIPAARALKGLGYGTSSGDGAAARLKSVNTQWNYGWSAKYSLTPTNFIPMVRDADYVDKDILNIRAQLSTTKTKHLLGFNEPDLSSQANMSVDEAIRLWPKLESTGLRLGSPATIKPNALWMDEFMTKAKAKGLRIDFVTMHCYQWPNAGSFFTKLDTLHDKWGLPIWVTEYAVADWNATATRKNIYSRTQVNEYMQETVEGMRARPYVERFAWKTRKAGDYVMGSSALFHTDGALTTTGKLYASL